MSLSARCVVALVVVTGACRAAEQAPRSLPPRAATTTATATAATVPRPIPPDTVFNEFADVDGGGILIPRPEATDDAGPPAQVTQSTHLIDAGAAPKKPIAYSFSNRSRTMTVSVETTQGGQKQTFHASYAVTCEPKAGSAKLTLRITKLDISPPRGASPDALAKLRQAERAVIGRSGTLEADPHGVARDFSLDPGKDDELASRVLGAATMVLLIPLPKEPVGRGAKWVHTLSLRDGSRITTTATVTLLARHSSTATLDVHYATTASANDANLPQGSGVFSTMSASYKVILRPDGIAKRANGSSRTSLTTHSPDVPDKTSVVVVAEHMTSE
jgi:hypothetical protein